ncbi:hypothetical protein ONZ51_g489 [Trametes cubensis]|uniref:Uncharacterized protein n=1 Tax=Trametes cubensis TaxID=1111947 RepID=A0AAD7XIN1_9APHY|nr:hypothetical protein ONZ51_g489 [Trametes cubensis]
MMLFNGLVVLVLGAELFLATFGNVITSPESGEQWLRGEFRNVTWCVVTVIPLMLRRTLVTDGGAPGPRDITSVLDDVYKTNMQALSSSSTASMSNNLTSSGVMSASSTISSVANGTLTNSIIGPMASSSTASNTTNSADPASTPSSSNATTSACTTSIAPEVTPNGPYCLNGLLVTQTGHPFKRGFVACSRMTLTNVNTHDEVLLEENFNLSRGYIAIHVPYVEAAKDYMVHLAVFTNGTNAGLAVSYMSEQFSIFGSDIGLGGTNSSV